MARPADKHDPLTKTVGPIHLVGGLDQSREASLIEDNQLSVSNNITYLSTDIVPRTRNGFTIYSTNSCSATITGMWDYVKSDGTRKVVLVASNAVYYMGNDRTLNLVGTISGGATKPHMITFNDNLCIADGTLTTYDGSSLSTVSGMTVTALSAENTRLVATGDPNYPDRLYESGVQDETEWTLTAASGTVPPALYVDIDWKAGGLANAATPFVDRMIISKSGTNPGLYALNTGAAYDTGGDWRVDAISNALYFVNPWATVHWGQEFWWINNIGVWRMTAADYYSRFVPYESGQPINGNFRKLLNQTEAHAFYNPRDQNLWFLPRVGPYIYVYHPAQKTWCFWVLAGSINAASFCYVESSSVVLMGAEDGYVYQYNPAAYQDEGTDYTTKARTKIFSPGSELYRYILNQGTATIAGITGASSATGTLRVRYNHGYIAETLATFTPLPGSDYLADATGFLADASEELGTSAVYFVDSDAKAPQTVNNIMRDFQLEVETTAGAISLVNLFARVGVSGRAGT